MHSCKNPDFAAAIHDTRRRHEATYITAGKYSDHDEEEEERGQSLERHV